MRRILCKLSALRVDNPEDAEDLVQETLLTLAQKCPVEELRKGILIWAMAVLHRKVGNYYRRSRRLVPLEENGRGEERIAAGGNCTPEASFRYLELRRVLQSILNQLPREERQVVALALSGYPTGEIARRLRPERYQNVVNRLFRGRNRIHRELLRQGYRIPRAIRDRSRPTAGRGSPPS